MRILVNDASVLIDLSRWKLIEATFQLNYEFVIPDALFEEELIDLGRYSRTDLVNFGLNVQCLSERGMSLALRYQAQNIRLSLLDCMALSLAKTNRYGLLTGDQQLRMMAKKEGIEVHGLLWVLDELSRTKSVSQARLLALLEKMLKHHRTRLPRDELVKRINRLKGKRLAVEVE